MMTSGETPSAATDGIIHYCFNPYPSPVPTAVFLDRDGTINERVWGGYVMTWPEFKFLPGAKAALRELSHLPDRIIVVSNQQCVGKGLMRPDELQALTACFVEEIRAHGGRIDDVYYCPHLKEQDCACRKPAPGLLLQAAADCRLDLPRCCMIGDSVADVHAAQAAGCAAVIIDARSNPGPESALDLGAATQLLTTNRNLHTRFASSGR